MNRYSAKNKGYNTLLVLRPTDVEQGIIAWKMAMKVLRLESFGFSAPYTVLDERIGFKGKNFYEQVKNMI